MNGCESSLKV